VDVTRKTEEKRKKETRESQRGRGNKSSKILYGAAAFVLCCFIKNKNNGPEDNHSRTIKMLHGRKYNDV